MRPENTGPPATRGVKVPDWKYARMQTALRTGGFNETDVADIISTLGWEPEHEPPPRLPTEPGSLIEVYEIDKESAGPHIAILDDTGEWQTAYQSLTPNEITGFRITAAVPVGEVCTEPTHLWRAIGPYDSHAWAESGNEAEVRARLRPRDRLERLYTSRPTTTWKEEPR